MNERREAPHLWTLGLTLGVLTVALHLATAADSWDLFRDELYYLANARHLGAGYVDHPPLVGWSTALFRALLGDSKLAIRVWPALAAGGTVFATCGLARELGGRRWAQLTAGLAAALAPGCLALFGILSMNAADLLLWALAFWAVARVLGRGESSAWVLFGLVAGLGLLNKLSMLFLLAGLAVGLLVTGGWRHLRSRNLWIGAALAMLLASPYVVWQIVHGWPTVEFMENAAAGKIAPIGPVDFLLAQWAPMGWIAAPLALAGLGWLLIAPAARPWRPLGWTVVAVLVLLLTQRAKPYYFSPAFTMLFAAGGTASERWTARLRPRAATAVRLAAVLLLVAADLPAFPLVKPVLDVEETVAYQASLGLRPDTDELHELGRLSQFFADRLGWRDLAATVAGVYASLPPADRATACVFGQNYGQAGAIDYYRRELDLPPVVSGHNSYWVWGPGSCTGQVLIVIGGERDELDELFASTDLATTFRCADCMPYEAKKEIWVARGLRAPLAEAWPAVRHYD